MTSGSERASSRVRRRCLGGLQRGLAWQVKRITAEHVSGMEGGTERGGGGAGTDGRAAEVSEEVGRWGEG